MDSPQPSVVVINGTTYFMTPSTTHRRWNNVTVPKQRLEIKSPSAPATPTSGVRNAGDTDDDMYQVCLKLLLS